MQTANLTAGEHLVLKRPGLRLISGRSAIALAGLGLLIWLISSMDLRRLLSLATGVSWSLPLILALHPLQVVFKALGWRAAMGANGRKVSAGQVIRAYWQGHVINTFTPVACLGDGWAAALLRDRLAAGNLVASVLLLNLLAALAAGVLVCAGPAGMALIGKLDSRLAFSLIAAGAALVVAAGVLYLALKNGLSGGLARWLARIPGLRRRDWSRLVQAADRVDVDIALVLEGSDHAFRRGLLFWLSVRALQVIEGWILLLGMFPNQDAISLLGLALLSRSAAMLVASVLTFIPGQLGVAEGGSVMLFGLLGLDPAAGLALECLHRFCRYAVASIGIGIGLVERSRPITGPEFQDSPALEGFGYPLPR